MRRRWVLDIRTIKWIVIQLVTRLKKKKKERKRKEEREIGFLSGRVLFLYYFEVPNSLKTSHRRNLDDLIISYSIFRLRILRDQVVKE